MAEKEKNESIFEEKETAQATNTDISAKKKESPFLSSEPVKDAVAEEDTASTKKQHEHIDSISKDRSIFNDIGKLYFLSKKTGKLETRGKGKFLILKDDAGMYKLMMIRDQVMLKGCNHYISPKCTLIKATQVANSWIWKALCDESDAEKNEKETLYFATFNDEETAKLFEEKYNFAMEENSKVIEIKKEKSETSEEKKTE